MKNRVLKIVISIIVILTAAIFVHFLSEKSLATSDGTLRIVIVDINGITVYDGNVNYLEDDSFFDVLQREFELTCASSSYQADASCSYNFQSFAYEGKILLGIAHDDFSLQTDWSSSFLAFELFDGTDYYLATQGISQIQFHDLDQIRISVRKVSEGLS